MTKRLTATGHQLVSPSRREHRLRTTAEQHNPRTQMLLALQRTAGNSAVASWLTSLVPVQRKKKKAKPKPKPTLQVTINDKGRVHSSDAGATLIGFKDSSGTIYVRDSKDKNTSTFYEAGGTPTVLTKLRHVDVTLEGADGATVVTFGSATIDAVLTEDDAGVVVDNGGTPVAPLSMPASLRDNMVADVRLELADGLFWVLMTFPDNTLQWVKATHKKSDYTSAEKDIKDEAANLPANKKKDFEKVSRFVSMVKMMEADFGDKSGAKDPMASVGIFQWGMPKHQSADAGSLGRFLNKLKKRATTASDKEPDKRTDEDTLYINAWKQCTDAGLDVSGTDNHIKITLDGDEAKGEDVESALADEMGTGALRTYQLIAAMDWIDDMKATIVMPGELGKKYVGNGYSPYGATQVTLKGAKRSLVVTMPDAHLTVGDACGDSEEALAVLADVLPNRPAFVQTSLWRAVGPDDVEAQVTAKLASIEAAEPKPAPPDTGKKKKKPKPPPALSGATVVDKADYEKIQGLLWPSAVGDDDTLVDRFETYALELYKGDKSSNYKKRAARMASVHIVNW